MNRNRLQGWTANKCKHFCMQLVNASLIWLVPVAFSFITHGEIWLTHDSTRFRLHTKDRRLLSRCVEAATNNYNSSFESTLSLFETCLSLSHRHSQQLSIDFHQSLFKHRSDRTKNFVSACYNKFEVSSDIILVSFKKGVLNCRH